MLSIFIHFIKFCVYNAGVFQRVFMNLNMIAGQSCIPIVVSTYSEHFDCVLPLVNCADCYVWIRQKVRYAPDQS